MPNGLRDRREPAGELADDLELSLVHERAHAERLEERQEVALPVELLARSAEGGVGFDRTGLSLNAFLFWLAARSKSLSRDRGVAPHARSLTSRT